MIMMMRADDSYVPAKGCEQEEILSCLAKSLAGEVDYDACKAACANEEEQEVLPGYAKVSGKAEASQSVALNAVDKKIGTITLKAGENDTTVTAVEITKAGLGAASDISNIQLMKNGEYVTNNGQLNSNKVAKLRFRPNLVLKANSSETFDVVVSMAGSGTAQPGGTHDFSVTAVTVANGTFDGTPVKLGSLTTTNYVVPEATISLSATTLKAGESNKEIARVNVASPVNATLTSITVTSSNVNNEDLFNILSDVKAYVDDKVVGTVSVNEETIVISDLNTEIEKNEDIDVVLKGTDIYVGNLAGISLDVETGHVAVFEKNTNERMNSTMPTTATLTLQGVDLKLTNNVTTAQNVSFNQKNVVLLDMTVSSSNEIEVAEFYVKFPFTGNTLASGFKDQELTLYVDGIDYTIKPTTLSATGRVWYSDKNDYFTVSANNSVKVQIKGTPTEDAPASISNIEFGITKAKNVDEKNPFGISTIKKSSHKTNVKGGSITVSKATTPSANTIEMGSEQDVLFFKVKSPSEDVKLTGFALTIEGNDADDLLTGRSSTPITNVAVYDKDGNSIADFDFDGDNLSDWTIASTKISTGIVISDFTKTISEGDTVEFVVKATFDNGEIVDLGNSYKFSLTAVYGQGVTSKQPIPTISAVNGTEYNVVTEKPDLVLVKNGKFINVTVKNDSTYDVVFNSGSAVKDTGVIAIDIESVATSNDNYLLNLSAPLPIEVLDGENGNVLGVGNYSAGVITVTFNDQFNVSAGAEETFTIKMVSTTQILDTSYNVSKKSANFNYYDENSTPKTSKGIEVKY